MTNYSNPVTEIIKGRFSCRKFAPAGLEKAKMLHLRDYIASVTTGIFGTTARFTLIAAENGSAKILKGLGTYGFIKDAPAFILGAVSPCEKYLEDYGYMMERIILYATDIGLGTCWLGGTFTKSSFAGKISLSADEQMPAVTAVGQIIDASEARDTMMRRRIKSFTRKEREYLFFDGKFGSPLANESAGKYSEPLEMVRLAPSASNKQPWRIVRDGNIFHFYLQRTKGYRESLTFKILKIADIQRIDMGIAMCHFELTASELGLGGKWVIADPKLEVPDDLTGYCASWVKI